MNYETTYVWATIVQSVFLTNMVISRGMPLDKLLQDQNHMFNKINLDVVDLNALEYKILGYNPETVH